MKHVVFCREIKLFTLFQLQAQKYMRRLLGSQLFHYNLLYEYISCLDVLQA